LERQAAGKGAPREIGRRLPGKGRLYAPADAAKLVGGFFVEVERVLKERGAWPTAK
jgi:hypothetical protein